MKDYKPVISIVGLGYVGLPVAVAFSKKFKVIGFDINQKRISALQEFNDVTEEVSSEDLKNSHVHFTAKAEDLKQASFHIVAVPTPINHAKQPDMSLVHRASETVGKNLKAGDIVVYESTVYPGATEEECVPILEKFSGLKCGADFKVGYSPERINPGDKEHSFEKIKKVVSGQDAEALEKVAYIYGEVVTAGVYRAASIKVAEAAKVIENTQRDLNVAFVNELSKIFHLMNIDTKSVLDAASTKWNFLNFRPGLVGGHCIGVDPFYLTYKAETLGYHPEVILAGRRINDNMGKYVAQNVIELLVQQGKKVGDTTVNLVGLTFKEDCPDIRNTRVIDIYNELKRMGLNVVVCDPMADVHEVKEEFGIELVSTENLKPADVLILAVKHKKITSLPKTTLNQWLKDASIFIDLKGFYEAGQIEGAQGKYWRL